MGETAQWKGKAYRRRFECAAKVTWVQGEFYWRVQRDETARVADYEGTGSEAALRLSREQTGSEVTWSAGRTLAADAVAEAFAIPAASRRAMQRDVSPLSSFSAGTGFGLVKWLVIIFVVLVLIGMLAQCDGNDCDETRNTFGEASAEYRQCMSRRHSGSSGRSGTSGGSYGGWSSGGGGHK